MSNIRTVSQEDLDKYPSLRGKKVGDTITAEEDYRLREGKEKKAVKPEVKVNKLAPLGRFAKKK